MIEVINTDSHASGSQVLGEVCHRLVDVFLWQLFPDSLQSDFQLISVLGFSWSLCTFPVRHPRRDSPVGSNLESFGPMILILSMNLRQFASSKSYATGRRLAGR